MPEEVRHKCNIPKCNVVADGKCYEAHDNYLNCPHYNASVYVPSQETVEKEATKFIDLYSGTELDFQEALDITRKALTRVIVLAGAADSGKTTLIASLYEKFLRGSLANYSFAGSKTLLGFDKRNHLSRIASGRNIPDTERTKRGFDKKLLHLKVRLNDLSKPAQDLLFSDISGETFEMAMNSADECKKLSIIKRADHFVLILDGKKISSTKHRQSTLQDADMLLRRCVETGMIGMHSFVDVLFTKYDEIVKSNGDEALQFVEHIKQEFKRKYNDKLGRLHFFMVAARPDDIGILPLFYGIEDVFPNWVEKSPFLVFRENQVFPKLEFGREFDKFSLKHFTDKGS